MELEEFFADLQLAVRALRDQMAARPGARI